MGFGEAETFGWRAVFKEWPTEFPDNEDRCLTRDAAARRATLLADKRKGIFALHRGQPARECNVTQERGSGGFRCHALSCGRFLLCCRAAGLRTGCGRF